MQHKRPSLPHVGFPLAPVCRTTFLRPASASRHPKPLTLPLPNHLGTPCTLAKLME